MDLISLLITVLMLALVGFIVWIIITYIPMPDLFKTVIIVAVAVLVVLYLIGLLAGHAPPLVLRR